MATIGNIQNTQDMQSILQAQMQQNLAAQSANGAERAGEAEPDNDTDGMGAMSAGSSRAANRAAATGAANLLQPATNAQTATAATQVNAAEQATIQATYLGNQINILA